MDLECTGGISLLKKGKRWLLRLLPIVYMGLIWLQSAHFQPQVIGPDIHIRVAATGVFLENAHYFMFGVLYMLFVFAALTFGPMSRWKEGLSLVGACVYAVVDEIHQYFVPFRSMSVDDLLKNGVGIFTAYLILHYAYYYFPRSTLSKWMRNLSEG